MLVFLNPPPLRSLTVENPQRAAHQGIPEPANCAGVQIITRNAQLLQNTARAPPNCLPKRLQSVVPLVLQSENLIVGQVQ